MKCVLRTIEKHNSKQPDEFSKDSVTNGLDHKFMKPLDYNSGKKNLQVFVSII